MEHEIREKTEVTVTLSDAVAKNPLASAALLMGAFAVLIRLSLHNLAFWGDCWFVLYGPYFDEPWEAVKSHALRFGRPGEVLYYIPMLKLAGFEARLWLLVSFFWLGAASLLCGSCLRRSFPDLKILHVGVPLLVFFSAGLGPLVYRMDLDQGRLCLLFFWISTACYQGFLLRRDRGFLRNVWWLVLAGLAYLYSLLSYEASLLLFPAIGILLLPLCLRLDKGLRIRSVLETVAMMVLVPAIYMGMRYTLFGGGKDKPLRNIPRLDGFPEATRNAFQYLAAPLQHIQWDLPTVFVLLASLGGAGCLLLGVARLPEAPTAASQIRRQAGMAIACGVVIFLAGISPYLLGTYLYDRTEFVGHSRIFASAWYGFAIALVGILSIIRAGWFRWISAVLLTAVAGGGATLIYDLHRDWETSADISAHMWRDFFKQVPDVDKQTVFIFKDLYCGIPVTSSKGYRAAVNMGFNGIRDFIRIAYDDETLGATFLFTDARTKNAKYRFTATGADPVLTGLGLPWSKTAYPGGRYILVERKGYTLKVVDRWTPENAGAGLEWKDGATQIETNRKRIKPLPDEDRRTPEERVNDLGYVLPPSVKAIRDVHLQ